jgi:UDP-N-acetylglucosamine--N-acetylmuramyl-(pentapeptide) pyrophosphoryl-undecaprenol N-acetylglucosamine transferase
MKLVITGGHHSSALPVIRQLRAEHPEVRMYWFGHKFSAQGDTHPTLEFHEITALSIPFYHIHAGKFYRTVNLWRLIKIPLGVCQCLFLLAKLKPDAILSFGGYIAVPTVLAGWILGIPAVTHEQTVVAGWANRVVAKFATKVLVSWPQSAKYFPKAKTVVVGLPLRQEIFKAVSQSFELNTALPTVYITTGKIGSHIINQVVGEALGDLLAMCNVIHQCGDNSVYADFEVLTGLAQALDKPHGRYYLRKFIYADEIGEAFAKSAVVVARAGAHTTGELLALTKRCILIPIPWVSHNEQYENARVLVEAGLGLLLPEALLSKESLVAAVTKVLGELSGPGVSTGSKLRTVTTAPADLIVRQLLLLLPNYHD